MSLTTHLPFGMTPAEALGFTAELARAATSVAAEELRRGCLGSSRDILEGLAILNPYDAAAWVMLADLERRQGQTLAARVCIEVALSLAPDDEQALLCRAEVMLAWPHWRAQARHDLRLLAGSSSAPGARARALLSAMGPAEHERALEPR